MHVLEVFADVGCPFTHAGLRRFVDQRDRRGRHDVRLRVRAWPLEIVNGQPLDPAFIAEEVEELQRQVVPGLFRGFRTASFPASSLPAMTLAAAAYGKDVATGEEVSLALRDLLFEQGQDIADPAVLDRVARIHELSVDLDDHGSVLHDHEEGVARGVIGSPHYFTPAGGFFCPSLDVKRDEQGHLHIRSDPEAFDQFLEACFEKT